MLTQRLIGYFDVKVYNPKKPRDQWETTPEGNKIGFRCTFDGAHLPQELAGRAKQYTDRSNNARFAVEFKVGNNCKWFNARGEQIDKPLNTALDGVKYEAIIDYKELNGDPSKMEACGYWVNAIMVQEVVTNPFEGMAFDTTPRAEQPTQTAEEVAAAPVESEAPKQYADKLPF